MPHAPVSDIPAEKSEGYTSLDVPVPYRYSTSARCNGTSKHQDAAQDLANFHSPDRPEIGPIMTR